MQTAEEIFAKYLTNGQGDSEPINVEYEEEIVEEVKAPKGYKVTSITTGFKLSIPGTYSSVEHSETAEVFGEVSKEELQEIKEELIKQVANHTYVAASHYLKTLLQKVQ